MTNWPTLPGDLHKDTVRLAREALEALPDHHRENMMKYLRIIHLVFKVRGEEIDSISKIMVFQEKYINTILGNHEKNTENFSFSDKEHSISRTVGRSGSKLRKSWERPYPDLPSNHPKNLKKVALGTNVEPELRERVDEAARRLGLTRADMVDQLLRRALPEIEAGPAYTGEDAPKSNAG